MFDRMKYKMYNNDNPERLVACVMGVVGVIRKVMGQVIWNSL